MKILRILTLLLLSRLVMAQTDKPTVTISLGGAKSFTVALANTAPAGTVLTSALLRTTYPTKKTVRIDITPVYAKTASTSATAPVSTTTTRVN